jgi:hypothetical protein
VAGIKNKQRNSKGRKNMDNQKESKSSGNDDPPTSSSKSKVSNDSGGSGSKTSGDVISDIDKVDLNPGETKIDEQHPATFPRPIYCSSKVARSRILWKLLHLSI